MTFEEFFKKKKISLDLLQAADYALFTEFKTHFELMGDKSFDHTKKYWFNKLRRQYPLPVEPKVEKMRFENQVAEQTVTETLAEEASTATKPAFQPRFKKPLPVKPAEELPDTTKQVTEAARDAVSKTSDNIPDITSGEPASQPPKPAFKPRFKPGVTSAAPAAPVSEPAQQQPEATLPAEEKPEAVTGKPAFKPRFKPGITSKPAAPADSESVPPFTPQADNAANTDFKETTTEIEGNPASAEDEQPAAPKPAFKPRFKPGLTKATPTTEKPVTDDATPPVAPMDIAHENDKLPKAAPASDAPKPAYKPRFTPKMAKPKPPESE